MEVEGREKITESVRGMVEDDEAERGRDGRPKLPDAGEAAEDLISDKPGTIGGDEAATERSGGGRVESIV